MGRRPNPTPKRYVAKDGTVSYVVRYRNGKVQSTETFHVKRAADDFCADIRDFGVPEALVRLEARLSAVGARGVEPTLREVFEAFIDWKRPRVRSSRTIEGYETIWELAIEPTLGDRPVSSITDADVQEWVDEQVAGRLAVRVVHGEGRAASAKTIANRHGLLHSVFDYASHPARRLVPTNPCSRTDLPKVRKGAPKGLRPGEWAALHAALSQLDPDAADLALALYATGARFGEVTALTTWDVEDDGDLVVVTIGSVLRREAGGIFVRVDDTKSEAGFRAVALDVDASDMVRRRVTAASPGGYVFLNRHGRTWRPATFRVVWVKACDVANLSRRPTPHWLRHTHVADLLREGASLPEVQARVGHEHIETTVGTYARTIDGVNRDILRRLPARRRAGAVGAGLAPREPLEAGPVVPGEVV